MFTVTCMHKLLHGGQPDKPHPPGLIDSLGANPSPEYSLEVGEVHGSGLGICGMGVAPHSQSHSTMGLAWVQHQICG